MNQTAEVGAPQGVLAICAPVGGVESLSNVAAKTGTGLLVRRQTALAEETERALALLSERFSGTAQQQGDPDE